MSLTEEITTEDVSVEEESTTHAIVRIRTEEGTAREIAELASVSAMGAGFYIQRECAVGTLVSLMLPIDAELRCYDQDKEYYKIWGLVQHCQPLSSETSVGYHVGVAFIGADAPESYDENPAQAYKICGMSSNGLWRVTESRAPFKVRRHVRYWTKIDLYLALLDAQRDTLTGERTSTENVSKNGAAVLSELDLNVGDRVKFICEKFDFSGLAVVCGRQKRTDGKTRLHLQFVENSFPVEKLDQRRINKTK